MSKEWIEAEIAWWIVFCNIATVIGTINAALSVAGEVQKSRIQKELAGEQARYYMRITKPQEAKC